MEIGLLRLAIHLPEAGSLKDKRRILRSVMDRARARHNVSVAEVDHHDLHQRSELAFVAVSSRVDNLERMFDQILAEAEGIVPGDVIEADREYLG